MTLEGQQGGREGGKDRKRRQTDRKIVSYRDVSVDPATFVSATLSTIEQ